MSEYDKPNKQQWKEYLIVQVSGITNMMAINIVCSYSRYGLTKSNCFYIMKHYEELEKEYDICYEDITEDDLRNYDLM